MMNNEDFDKAIRQKLEGLNQTYTESDIDKVNRHVRGKRRFPFKGGTGSWLLYSLSAAAFTLVTIWTVSHFNEKGQGPAANQKIARPVINSTSDNLSTGTTLADSIVPDFTENVSANPLHTEKDAIPVIQTKTQNLGKGQEIASLSAVKTKTAIPEPKPEKVGNKTILRPGRDKTELHAAAGNDVTNISEYKKLNSPDSVSVISGEGRAASGLSEVMKPFASEAGNDQKSDINESLPVKPNDSQIIEKPALIEKTPDTAFQNKGIIIRAGVDFQFTNQSFATGIAAEVLFSNNLSFETGLRYRSYYTEHYTDRDDLFRRKHHDLKGRIEKPFEGKDHITDLFIHNRILEIPVTLKYYVPMRNNFRLAFALGTDLDIYLNQELSFNHLADSGKVITDYFSNRGDVMPFNNLIISAGIEKQWKSWGFQLQPFIKPRLQEVFYKPKELEFGVGISVKYNFGK